MSKCKQVWEAIVAIIVALIGLIFYFKKEADKAKTDAILGETKGQDKILKDNQVKIEDQIKKIEVQDDSKLTDQQRADRWNK